MFSLSEGPQQSAPAAAALAATAPAAEAVTGTNVFPAVSLKGVAEAPTSSAGTALVTVPAAAPATDGSNSNSSSSSNSSGNGSSSSNNDTTSNHNSWWEATCVGALLRPFDPGKGCQQDARRGKAVLGVDLPFDCGKA